MSAAQQKQYFSEPSTVQPENSANIYGEDLVVLFDESDHQLHAVAQIPINEFTSRSVLAEAELSCSRGNQELDGDSQSYHKITSNAVTGAREDNTLAGNFAPLKTKKGTVEVSTFEMGLAGGNSRKQAQDGGAAGAFRGRISQVWPNIIEAC